MRAVWLILSVLLVACGDEESETKEEPNKPAMCKTLKDGTVDRYEISASATELRAVLVEMGFQPCE